MNICTFPTNRSPFFPRRKNMKTLRIALVVIALLAAAVIAPMVVSAVSEVPAASACADGSGNCG